MFEGSKVSPWYGRNLSQIAFSARLPENCIRQVLGGTFCLIAFCQSYSKRVSSEHAFPLQTKLLQDSVAPDTCCHKVSC